MDINHLTLLTDLYELTMMQGYFKTGNDELITSIVFHNAGSVSIDDISTVIKPGDTVNYDGVFVLT